jgi:hypothetical protein
MVETAYVAVALIGLLHGLEPGHGWPIATLYASTRPHPLTRAFVSSSVISIAHLVSSVVIVAAYAFLRTFLQFAIPYLNVVAGAALAVLGLRFLLKRRGSDVAADHGHTHEDFTSGAHTHAHAHPGVGVHTHKHKHRKKAFLSLTSLASFAFVLGFAHEEEFALLTLAVAGIDALTLMLVYAATVMVALIGVTLLAVKIYAGLQVKIQRYEVLMARVSGLVLFVTAVTFFFALR